MLMAKANIRERIRYRKYYTKCSSSRHIKAAVSTAEQEIKVTKNKIEVI